VFDGDLRRLVHQHATHKLIEVQFQQPVDPRALNKFGDVDKADDLQATLRVPRDRVPTVAGALLRELPVVDIAIEETSAEEVIRAIFQDRGDGPVDLGDDAE